RIGAPFGILVFSAAAAFAAPARPALVTPALLSMNNLTTASAPELRVVASALSARDLGTPTRTLAVPGAMRLAPARAFVNRGMEALARYSASRVDQSPTPWDDGIHVPEADRPIILEGTATMRVLATDEVPGSAAYGASRTIDPHAGMTWSASA